jgi:hypothetical protein
MWAALLSSLDASETAAEGEITELEPDAAAAGAADSPDDPAAAPEPAAAEPEDVTEAAPAPPVAPTADPPPARPSHPTPYW